MHRTQRSKNLTLAGLLLLLVAALFGVAMVRITQAPHSADSAAAAKALHPSPHHARGGR